jgi:CRP/FNR family cyclic AMP-dependent transcriptional regulator
LQAMTVLLWDNLFRRTTPERAVSAILKETILFQDLTPRELTFVNHIVHPRNYQKDEIIFHRGETGVGMYIIVSGGVDITIPEHRALPEQGITDIVIARLGAGDFFGELALVEEGGRRSATAKASRATELIGFFKPDLLEILERNPSAGVKITLRLGEVLGRRLKDTTERVSVLEEQLKSQRTG